MAAGIARMIRFTSLFGRSDVTADSTAGVAIEVLRIGESLRIGEVIMGRRAGREGPVEGDVAGRATVAIDGNVIGPSGNRAAP